MIFLFGFQVQHRTKRVLEIDASTAQASKEPDRRMIMNEVDKAEGPRSFRV